ncbi:HAMP domain-containing sensor histidine kinase [Streptomyces sp. NPDC048057]|uniref:sensor histidine kinase n=1 Tax=Streptomyces sp. NPDC048057 TaxID=3155628 RepID=UPI0033D0EC2D
MSTALDPTTSEALVKGRPRRLTARLRLTLSYALFVVITAATTLFVVYVVMRFVPNYPLTAANPRDNDRVPSREEILDALLRISGFALFSLAVVGLVGGWFIAGRVLQPLQDITDAALQAAEGSLDHRVGLAGPRDEFTHLSDAFDHMLDRLQQSFEAQQRFAANASHELRTPLAVNRALLDVARADPDGQDYPQLVSRLYETNQRGIEIVNALLQLSALGHTPPELAPLDLSETVTEALDVVRPEAAARSIAVHATVHPVSVTANDVLLQQLTVNLLHNAIRHNLPNDGRLELTAGPSPTAPGHVDITVSNTGSVLRPEAVATFTEPFLRGEGRTSGTGPSAGRRGHGLGLAIVAAITTAHHGELILTPHPEGGLTATVRLPAAAD